jgi:hypothetical protein
MIAVLFGTGTPSEAAFSSEKPCDAALTFPAGKVGLAAFVALSLSDA